MSAWTSHRYTHVFSPWTSLPPPALSHPSRLSQSTRLSSLLCYTGACHYVYIMYIHIYICICIYFSATFSIRPTLSFPQSIHKSVLYIRVSIPAQQIGSSVPFPWIPYMCFNILYLFFSFWLISLCITGCRFIHLTGADSYLLVRTILVHINLGWLCDLPWLIKCPNIDGMLVLCSALKRPRTLSPLSGNQHKGKPGWMRKTHSPVFPITQAQTATSLVSKTLQKWPALSQSNNRQMMH